MPTILGANTLSTGYDVENSLKFNDGDTPNLVRTISSGADVTKFTFSFWCKRCTLGGDQRIYSNENTTAKQIYIRFNNNNTFTTYHQGGGSDVLSFDTNAIFRDTTGWYHFHFLMDSTQGTESDRFKMHVNGQQITSFNNPVYPSSNEAAAFLNSSEKQNIGFRDASAGGGQHFDGYLAETVLLQGVAEPYTTFGEFDEDSPNIWKPKDFKNDVTFGTNGFYLEFKQTGTSANSSGIGADTSGNDNHLTPSNLAATDVTTDTCTNNYAVLNPLTVPNGASLTLAEGNLTIGGNQTDSGAKATLGVSAGKWYWEIKAVVASGGSDRLLVATEAVRQITSATDENSQGIWGIQSRSGTGATLNSFTNGTFSNGNSGSTGFNDNTIIGVALDADNGKLYFHKDGTYTDLSGNTGNPADGTNPTFTGLPTDGTFLFPYVENRPNGTPSSQVNFGGAPSFAISSGNSDANGYGNFEYSVPSGHYALNTKNLAEHG